MRHDMRRLRVPETPDELTPAWLTAALAETGVLRHGAVAAAELEHVGEEYGFTGLVAHVRLRYRDADGDVPNSLIAKLPMARGNVVSGHRARQERDPALARRYYERCVREERFYREVGATFAPTLYYSAVDDDRRRVVLLLEDLTAGRQGDVLTGCSIEDAALVIEEIAPFHAQWWGERAPIHTFPRAGDDHDARQERYAGEVDLFLERYGDALSPAVRHLLDRLRSRLAAVRAALTGGSQTLIHADLHLDNVIFDSRAEGRSAVVLDWQTSSVGSPAWDVALFLFGSLSIDDRRAAEDALLDRYTTLIAEHGVRDYGVDDLRRDCRLALLAVLAGTVGWLTNLDPNELSDRERALQKAVLTDGRLFAALLDHDVIAVLER
jgi:Phosphotransferase enzyme family